MFAFRCDPDQNHGLGLGFTDRDGGLTPGPMGSLNLGRTLDDRVEHVAANFERLGEAISQHRFVTLSQVHGRACAVVDQTWLDRWDRRSHLGSPGGAEPLVEADAMVTALPEVVLCIRVADCVPVLLADAATGVLGAAHAGRAGFEQGVLAATVERMRALGATNVQAWIGPHVCGDCYEVPDQMARCVDEQHPGTASTTSWGTPSLDLGRGCERQLEALGVAVTRLDPCTRTTASLHSHRRDGAAAGRAAGIIWRVSAPSARVEPPRLR